MKWDYRVGHIIAWFIVIIRLISKPKSLFRAIMYGPVGSYYALHESVFPTITVDDMFPASWNVPVHITRQGHEGGSTNILETIVLSSIVAYTNPKVIVEIGTYQGKTTQALYQNSSPAAQIYTIDLPSVSERGHSESLTDLVLTENQERPFLPEDSRVNLLLQDSKTIDLGQVSAIDFAFIDGSHSYEYARSDTELILRHLSPTGVIVWHDASLPEFVSGYGVRRYLAELSEEVVPLKISRILGTSLAIYSRFPGFPK